MIRALSTDTEILTEYDLDDLLRCLCQIHGHRTVSTTLAELTGKSGHLDPTEGWMPSGWPD